MMKKSKLDTKRLQGRLATKLRPKPGSLGFAEVAAKLAEIGKGFYARGWVLGTSGNFSAVISREPLCLAMTSTGLDKGELAPAQFLEIDQAAKVVRGEGQPSAASRWKAMKC